MKNCERVSRIPALPVRPADAHKGTFGSVLLIAGSEGMSGAAILAGRAALHGGAGLVTVAVPRTILPVVAMAHPSYMSVSLADDLNGKLNQNCLAAIDRIVNTKTAIAIGPGLGQSSDVQRVVQHVHQTCCRPLVLDADALNAFAGNAHILNDRSKNSPRIITPHPGEFARLTGLDTKAIQGDRESLAVEFARKHKVAVLLKGVGTVITDGQRIAVNTTGNSGMATGGSGDVLTGLIASLLAQGMDVFEAAQLGAYVHGLAGETASEIHSERFITSLELVQHLDTAWKRLE